MTFDQSEFSVRCEWGPHGLRTLAPISDVVVIVDVLSFCTAVDIAVGRGAVIFPYPLKNDSAVAYAHSVNANLPSSNRGSGFSLSPHSLQHLPVGYRLVLPSPNGAALSFSAEHPLVLTACLRNAAAVARSAARLGKTIAVIPAGEMWEDGTMRPSFEDWIGAGAVISAIAASWSPEAQLAAAGFVYLRHQLRQSLRTCSSGKELIERGFAADVELAAELNVSSHVAQLVDKALQEITEEPEKPEIT